MYTDSDNCKCDESCLTQKSGPADAEHKDSCKADTVFVSLREGVVCKDGVCTIVLPGENKEEKQPKAEELPETDPVREEPEEYQYALKPQLNLPALDSMDAEYSDEENSAGVTLLDDDFRFADYEVSGQSDSDNTLQATHHISKKLRMPGMLIYKVDTQKISYDRYAAAFLGLGKDDGSIDLRHFLNFLGSAVSRVLLAKLKSITPEKEGSNIINLNCVLPKGSNAGATVYVRTVGFFDPATKKPTHYSFTFTRQMPNNIALIPDLLTNNTSFTWLIKEDRLSFNRRYYRLLGYPERKEPLVLGFSTWLNTLIHPEDRNIYDRIAPVIETPDSGDSFEICYRSRCVNGNYIWTKSVGTVTARDRDGRATHIIGINNDINEMVDSFERLRSKVYTDVLTGLKNRTYLIKHVKDLIQPAMQPLSIIFFDATGLKLYNDYLGHNTGDKLLYSCAAIVQEAIYFEHELIRISGDEAVCILPVCDENMLQSVKEDLAAALDAYNIDAPLKMPIFFSLGGVTLDLNRSLYSRLRIEEARKHKENRLRQKRLTGSTGSVSIPSNPDDNSIIAGSLWRPDANAMELAYDLFFKSVQQADKLMQKAKEKNRSMHYDLIRRYIEHTIHRRISLEDSRLIAGSTTKDLTA